MCLSPGQILPANSVNSPNRIEASKGYTVFEFVLRLYFCVESSEKGFCRIYAKHQSPLRVTSLECFWEGRVVLSVPGAVFLCPRVSGDGKGEECPPAAHLSFPWVMSLHTVMQWWAGDNGKK